tara:strand:- start:124 stop:279 length:156 start_codon:yes stop_codon:yes gene_type:complete
MLPPLEDSKFHIVIKPTKKNNEKPKVVRNKSSNKLPEDLGVIFQSKEEIKE